MKRVLITGIGGAIGCHMFAHIMHNTDWQVVGIDSFRHKGHFDRVTTMTDAHPDWAERLEVLAHDLQAPLTSREQHFIGDVTYVVNLASLSDVAASLEDPVWFIRNNTELMLNMLEYARTVDIEAFLHFSTDEVYGPADPDQAHPEWSTILPSNPYSASKAAQEAIAIAYWRSYDVPVVLTNTMNNYGEMQAPSKFPALVQKHVQAGEPVPIHVSGDGQVGTRYYLHSRNAADAVLFLLEKTTVTRHEPGTVDRPDRYNIVGDVQLSNYEMAAQIADLMGKEVEFEYVNFHEHQPGHDLHYGLDGSKLKAMGWRPPMSFRDSMQQVIEWQQAHPDWIDSSS